MRRNSNGTPQRVQPRPSTASQVYIYIYVWMDVFMYVCVCVCAYIYIRIYIHTYTLTHSHSLTHSHTHTRTHRLIVSVYPRAWTVSQVSAYLRECGRVLEGVRSRGGVCWGNSPDSCVYSTTCPKTGVRTQASLRVVKLCHPNVEKTTCQVFVMSNPGYQ